MEIGDPVVYPTGRLDSANGRAPTTAEQATFAAHANGLLAESFREPDNPAPAAPFSLAAILNQDNR